MTELAVSIFMVAIIVQIYRRYRSVFSLPFFWAAEFALIYLGTVEIRTEFGGISYIYAAAAFGVFYLGLLAADFLVLYRAKSKKGKNGGRDSRLGEEEPAAGPRRQPQGTRIKLLFPLLPLRLGLFVSLIGATFVSFIFFSQNGIPILSSFPALAWVQSTSGVVNRLMSIFGPGCYASLGLIAWAVHRETGSRAAKGLMYLGLGLAIISQALLATKAAAIMVFIWFNIMLFYLNKKREFRKSILPFLIVVVPISAAIVIVRSMSSQGYWETGSVFQTFATRLTTEAAGPLDFIIKYSNRWGPMHGGAMHMEVERIREQLTGRTRTPILSEFVFDLMGEQSTHATGLSAALTIYGTGYAEWGLAGLILYAFLQGLAFGWTHRYLLRLKKMNLISLLLWGGVVSYLIAVSGTGTILIGLEGIFADAVPPLVLLLPFCGFFLLPMARRYRSSASGRTLDPVSRKQVHAPKWAPWGRTTPWQRQ